MKHFIKKILFFSKFFIIFMSFYLISFYLHTSSIREFKKDSALNNQNKTPTLPPMNHTLNTNHPSKTQILSGLHLSVEVIKDTDSETVPTTSYRYSITKQNTVVLQIKIKNLSQKSYQDIDIEYKIFGIDKSNSGSIASSKQNLFGEGTHHISKPLKNGDTYIFKTDPVKFELYSQYKTYQSKDRIKHNGTKYHSYIVNIIDSNQNLLATKKS